ncbi:ribosomal oxygenase 1-like [Mizuhopecten yessoensis]|uniref:Bifunctional lysine-specific demethylase and histidyl-hydroxylase n=1 Tax=Mizuhopecten yessoensis TaxID=6573 RepID=A0A210Q472_MIZYE|nr:ribosomal oxygenase 1-like [Mizuhopecten yessoensis]OWF43534.1 Bifunctional lysine-specific demethylase and histidyl-hydroxylase NO66 [Mizuhopecten yessoensis]
MKRVSAFSVFKSKKEVEPQNDIDRSTIRRAASTPAVNVNDDKKTDGRSKKILRALKSGSLRQSLRGTPKIRPSILKMRESGPVAGDGDTVKLTSLRASNSDLTNDSTPAVASKSHKEKLSSASLRQDTPKVPQTTIIKPRRKMHSGTNPLPPKGKVQSQSKPPIDSSQSSGKVKPRSVKDENSSEPQIKSPKSPASKENSSPKLGKEGESPNSRSTQKKTKRHHNSAENGTPSKKKKSENSKSDQFECSTEEIEQAMDFAEETVMENSNLPYMHDSTMEAKRIFECLIHPVKPDKFFKELWEKKPLLVKRHMKQYNDGWFSTAELDRILREENLQFSVNLDITTYTNGVRETHNPVGRAYAPVVWDMYQSGCSVRLLNPQTYSRNVWKLLSMLQEYFGCCVGANTYLTPPGTQGFAPHFDDIEAFILQLEGKKHWRLYSPRSDAEKLPRFSSGNFTDVDLGEPILEKTLEPGDLLYFPRGTIHQAKTVGDEHSLHITVSCYQKNTWGDLFEKLMPRAVQLAVEEDVEFRKGLPRGYLNFMGVANSDVDNPQRKEFLRKVEQMMMRMISNAPVDAACDQMGKQFIHDSLPPVLSEAEKSCSIHNGGEKWDKQKSQVVGATEIEPDTAIKIVRKGILRLLTEEDEVRIYHTLENARLYHKVDPQYIDVEAEVASAVEFLIHSYPEFVSVENLPLPTLEKKLEIATSLYEKGLLITGEPLTSLDDDSSCDN